VEETSREPQAQTMPAIERRTVMLGAAGLALAAVAPASVRAAETVDLPGALHVPARTIPVPKSISPEAQKYLAAGGRMVKTGGLAPKPGDIDSIRRYIAAANAAVEPFVDQMLTAPAKAERQTIGGVPVGVGKPDAMRHPERARLLIHGGAFCLLGGRYVLGDAAQAAADSGCMAYSVDYRMPPDHPYPAAIEDCVSVYRELIKRYDPKKIAISGASAGANLTATVALKIRDLGLPMPAALGMMSVASDLTSESDSRNANFGVDTTLNDKSYTFGDDIYTAGHDKRDPYISPVFADFTKGYAPTFLQTGTRDLLLSDNVRLHRALVRAEIEAELHVFEAMPHGGFGGDSPEDREVRTQFAKFIDKHMA
jgi:epsilon-lactone hydrolase